VAIRLMGFDERKIPKVSAPMKTGTLRITDVRTPGDVEVAEAGADAPRVYPLDGVSSERTFRPHPGWLNHIERGSDDVEDDRSRQGTFA